MSKSSNTSSTTEYCNRCKCEVPLEKFSKKKDGTYFRQCDYHREQNRRGKRRDYCLQKLEGITEEEAIRDPHSLDSLIYMIQEVRFHFSDRIKALEYRLDCLEASNHNNQKK